MAPQLGQPQAPADEDVTADRISATSATSRGPIAPTSDDVEDVQTQLRVDAAPSSDKYTATRLTRWLSVLAIAKLVRPAMRPSGITRLVRRLAERLWVRRSGAVLPASLAAALVLLCVRLVRSSALRLKSRWLWPLPRVRLLLLLAIFKTRKRRFALLLAGAASLFYAAKTCGAAARRRDWEANERDMHVRLRCRGCQMVPQWSLASGLAQCDQGAQDVCRMVPQRSPAVAGCAPYAQQGAPPQRGGSLCFQVREATHAVAGPHPHCAGPPAC